MLYKGHLATTEAIVLSTLVLKEVSLVSMVPPLLFIGFENAEFCGVAKDVVYVFNVQNII